MVAVRALQRRVVKLEKIGKPRTSPFVLMYGSFNKFVEVAISPGVFDGSLDKQDMIDIVAVLRRWEVDGTWDLAHAY